MRINSIEPDFILLRTFSGKAAIEFTFAALESRLVVNERNGISIFVTLFLSKLTGPTGFGGTGLGLSITKGFIEANKGTITLENKIGGGAKFQVTLPVETSRTNNLKNE